MNDWQTLGLEIGAPLEAVKIAYKALAKKLHPDVGGDSRMFVAVQMAYHRLEKQLTTPRKCGACNGSGVATIFHGLHAVAVICHDCKGTGSICEK